MQQTASTPTQFGVEIDNAYSGRHALVPVLLGLSSPLLVISIVDPRALASVSVIFHVYLFLLFVVAVGAYIYSVIEPGEITRVLFDRDKRKVTIDRAGLFATSTNEYDFADVAAVRMEARYDDDGYQFDMPVVVLSDQKLLPLPAGTTEGDIAAMRAILRRQ